MASDVILSPNMILPVPIVNVDPSRDWANNVNACLSIIDGHNHSPNSGVQINPDGININTDLSFNTHNVTFLRSVSFNSNSAPLSLPTDKGCLYESGVDLYYNDGNGTIIRITAIGAVTGAAGTITGLPSGTASAAFSAVTGTFVFQQATSTAANMDIGSLILRYPGSYPTPAGTNFITLEVPSSIAVGYSLTLPFPASTALEFMTLTNTGVMASVPFSTLGTTIGAVGANSIGSAMTSTGANSIASNVTSTGANAIASHITTGINGAAITTNTVPGAAIVSGSITGTQLVSNINLPGSTVLENGKSIVVANTVGVTPSLGIVRGIVNGSGGINGGEGFTSVRNGVGNFSVSYNAAWTDTPSVTITVFDAGVNPIVATIYAIGLSGFSYVLYDSSTIAAADTFICFIAIGRRS